MKLVWFIAFVNCAFAILDAPDLIRLPKFRSYAPSPSSNRILVSTSRFNSTLNQNLIHWECIQDDSKVTAWPWHVASATFITEDTVLLHNDGNLWTAEVEGCSLKLPKFIHSYPVTIENLKVFGDRIFFTANVWASNGTLEHAHEAMSPKISSGVLYKQLWVRHWDTYSVPGRYSQLFVAKVNNLAQPVNIMANTHLECPVAPFGDSSDYDIAVLGDWIAFVSRLPSRNMAWNTNNNIYLVKCIGTSCSQPNIITQNSKGYDVSPRFHPTKPILAWLRMKRPGYEADKNIIMLYDIRTGESTQHLIKWNRSPSNLQWSPDGSLYVTAEDFGRVKLFKVDFKHDLVKTILEKGSVGKVSWTPGSVWHVQSTMAHPPRLYRNNSVFYDPDPAFKLNHAQEFTFKSRDGTDIHGWYILPKTKRESSSKNHEMDMVLLIHGGPEGAWTDGWGWRWNPHVFAAKYLTVMINPRGSTGYGQKFTDGVNRRWGKEPYEDLMAGMKFVMKRWNIRRSCALGASYGGYMINWINGMNEHPFSCLVNHDGMFSATASYYSTDEVFFNEWEWGKPWKTKFKYDPASKVETMNTPTLFIHSERDYRLPVTEGIAAFTALQRRGIESRLLYFPDENHWITKPSNLVQWYSEIFSWLGKHLDQDPKYMDEEVDGQLLDQRRFVLQQ
jgi:dipeptidyl aminopeptidase/acylaminoacyl peptidase